MSQAPRRAHISDIPACARIVCAWEAETTYMPGHATEELVTRMMEEAWEAREFWVVGHPVDGYMSVDPSENKIGALYLTKRGAGTGKALMDIAKQGRDFLWLTVYVPNTQAQAFYQREGFQEVRLLPGNDPGEPDMLRMEWHRIGDTG
jgi:GNAT superfamily N-acetyltransferase